MDSHGTVGEGEKDTIPIEPPSVLDDDNLEDFFPDEDEQGISAVENLHGIMKRVSKKAALMIEGINHCQQRMDHNFNLIRSYMAEGRKPNLEFRR
jgi:hypothetical protein